MVTIATGLGLWLGTGLFSYGMSRHCWRRSMQYAVIQDECRFTAKDMKDNVEMYEHMIKTYEEMVEDFSKLPRAKHLYDRAVKTLERTRELYVERKEQYDRYAARLEKIDKKLEGYEKGYERWKGFTETLNPFDGK